MIRLDKDAVGRTMSLLGGRWGFLVMCAIQDGTSRFDALERELGIASNVLSSRLRELRAAGLITREPYQTRPTRYEYRPTPKGDAFLDVLIAMTTFGERHLADVGAP